MPMHMHAQGGAAGRGQRPQREAMGARRRGTGLRAVAHGVRAAAGLGRGACTCTHAYMHQLPVCFDCHLVSYVLLCGPGGGTEGGRGGRRTVRCAGDGDAALIAAARAGVCGFLYWRFPKHIQQPDFVLTRAPVFINWCSPVLDTYVFTYAMLYHTILYYIILYFTIL